jgi:hypothetical protein
MIRYGREELRALSDSLPDPAEAEDNLDGVTRNELVAAEIAKHKELLTPTGPDPLVAQVTNVARNLSPLHQDMLAAIAAIKPGPKRNQAPKDRS